MSNAASRDAPPGNYVANHTAGTLARLDVNPPVVVLVREIRVVVRIPSIQDVVPALLKYLLVRQRMQPPAARSLVVIEQRVRGVDDEMTSLPNLEAQVNVVEHDAQIFVKPADLVEHAPRHHHAGAGHRAAVACEICQARAPNRLSRPRPEGIRCGAVDADHDSGMLNPSICVQQLRTDCADFLALCVLEHRSQPVRMDYLEVVVEKQQLLAARVPNAKVVERRVVERLRPLMHLAS